MRNRKVWQGAFVACALVGGLSGCRTWMHSDKQSVTIFTNPPETSVVIDNYLQLTAPGTVTLSRKGNHVAQANKDGYEPTSLKIDRTWSWRVVGDIFGCLIIFSPFCIMHDIDLGGYYTFDDKVYVTLNRNSSPICNLRDSPLRSIYDVAYPPEYRESPVRLFQHHRLRPFL